MAWTNTQKALVARACKDAGIADEHRRLIVAQVPGQRAIHQGKATTTSPRLTQPDFEFVLATIESYSGGQVRIRDRGGQLRYEPGFWQRRLDEGELRRLRWVTRQIDHRLQAELTSWARDGEGLRGWIRNRVGAEHGSIDQLDYRQITDLVHGLRAYAKRQGVAVKGAA